MHGKFGNLKRTSVALAAVLGLIAGLLVSAAAVVSHDSVAEAVRPPGTGKNNPDLAASCGTDVVLVLDESGSISSANAITQVENAVKSFVTGLKGTGSRMRIAEFSTNARDASINGSTAFQVVNDTFQSAVNTYLGNGGNAQSPTNYNPGVGQQYTNWEAGLLEAAAPGSALSGGVGAPLVVFITDGNPNTVGTSGSVGEGGNASANDARDAAINEMAALQAAGGHVLSIAVGDAATDAGALSRLRNITEPNDTYYSQWDGPPAVLDIRTTDLLKVNLFSDLEVALREVVFGLCAPSVSLRKLDDALQPVTDDPTTATANDGWPFTMFVDGLSGAGAPASNQPFVWVSPTPQASVTAPSSRSARTNNSGIALFQWTPNTLALPRPWASTARFTEVLPPGWTIDSRTFATTPATARACNVERLNSNGTVSNLDVAVYKISPSGTPRPGDTVTFGFGSAAAPFAIDKSDIVTCDIINRRPAIITVTKNVDSLVPSTATDFAFTTTSPTSPAAAPGLPADVNLTGVTEAAPKSATYIVEPGTYTVRESEKSPWVLEGISCTGSGSATQPGSDPRVRQIVVGAGQNVNCVFSNRETPAPGLTITKTPDKTSFPEVTTNSVTYTVAVTNTTGERLEVTSLTDAAVLDPATGANQTGTFDLLNPADVGPKAGGTITANTCPAQFTGPNRFVTGSASRNCAFTVQYPGREAFDKIDDTVTIRAKDDFGRFITPDPSASATVNVTDVRPTLTVDKQNTGNADFVAPTGVASYSIKVTNTTIEPITVTTVSDTLYRSADNILNTGTDSVFKVLDITTTGGNVTETTCSALAAGLVIQPGDANAYTCTFTVDTAGLPSLVGGEFLINNVVVDVIDNDTIVPVRGSDDAGRPVLTEAGTIGVFKTDNEAEITEPGSQITYDIDVFNKTLTEPVTLTEFEDRLSFNGASIGSFVINAGDLEPTFTSVQATLVSTTCASIIGVVLAPAGSLDGNGRPTAAGASVSCEIVLDLKGNAGDLHSDVAVARGRLGQTPVSAENEAQTPVVDAKPVIRIEKAANPTSVPESGESVTFTFTIDNDSGATDPVSITSLSDNKLGDLFGTPNAEVTENNCLGLKTSTATTPIPPGGSVSCTVKATIKGEPTTPHVNTVSVQGVDDEKTPTNVATDDAMVTFTDEKPTIGVTKTAVSVDGNPIGDPKTVIETGVDVTFDIVVTNTSKETVWVTSLTDSVYGDITQKDPANVKVIDTTCALGAPSATPPTGGIPAGQTYTCSFTANVKRSELQELEHKNTVTAVAVDNDANSTPPVTDDEILPFAFVPPTVEMTKTDNDASVAEPGGDVTYFLEIKNTSNEPVTITKLTDVVNYQKPPSVSPELDLLNPAAPVVSSTCTEATIAAGATYKCEFVLTLTGTAQTVRDVAKVTVVDNDAAAGRIPPATATAEDSTPITDVKPVVEIVKTANPTTITPGQEVTYTYTIFNRSAVEDIEIISLVDDKFAFEADECQVIGQTLTKNDGDDASGTDQVSCEITRTNLLPADGENPLNFDHKNIVVVEAADDEILSSEEPKYVTDDDDAVVQVRKTAVTLDKSDATVTANTTNGTYQAVYTITVENTGAAGTYTLEDTFKFGPRVRVFGTPTVTAVGVPVLPNVPNTAFDGTTDKLIAAAVPIAAGSSMTPTIHTYTVTVFVKADLPSDVTYIDCKLGDTSGAGSGLLNLASITVDGGTPIVDDGCGDIPAVEFEKSDPVVTSNGDRTYDAVYTITAENTGGEAGTYTLTDTFGFSDGVSVVGQPEVTVDPDAIIPEGDFNGADKDVIVTGQSIGANTTHTYTVTVKVELDFTDDVVYAECDADTDGGRGLLNTAAISVDGGDPVEDDGCEDIPGDLQIEKTDGDITAIAGGAPFTYTLTITNVGGVSTGSPVIVTDVLPAEFEWVSYPDEDGALPFCAPNDVNPELLDCEIDPASVDLGGKSTTIELTARAKAGIDPDTVGYENLSYVDSPDDPAPDSPECPPAGQDVIEQRNGFDAIRLIEQLVQLLVLGNPDNNVACDRTPVIDGEIEVTKTDSVLDADSVVNGQTFSYELLVTNIGTSPLSDVALSDDLPSGLTLVSIVAGAGWTCNNADPIACTYGPTLEVLPAPGAMAPAITVNVRVTDSFVGAEITNVVEVSGVVSTPDDSKTVTDTDTEVTPLEPTLDLTDASETCIGDAPWIEFNVVAKGFVPVGATPVSIRVLDAEGDPVDYNGDGVVDDDDVITNLPLEGRILWPGASIVDGDTVDWPGWVFVNGLWIEDGTDQFLRDGLFLEVSVNPTGTTALIPYPPATSECADPEQAEADLQIVKTADNTAPEVGEDFNFTLVVTNNGPDLATGVVVTDNVPSTLSVKGVSSSDFTCSLAGNDVRCTRSELAVGASGTIFITASGSDPGSITNGARVTARQPDPNPSNNVDDATVAITEVQVLPPQPTPPPQPLPATGSNIDDLLRLALLAVGAGLGLTVLTIRRRRNEEQVAG